MFSMVAIGIAVFLTLTVHAVVSIRMGRVDLAVARALGFSRGQIFLSMAMERSVIVVLAVVTGGVMGYWPGLEILELIDLTPRGAAPVPPMLPSVQVWLVFGVISGLVAISAFSLICFLMRPYVMNSSKPHPRTQTSLSVLSVVRTSHLRLKVVGPSTRIDWSLWNLKSPGLLAIFWPMSRW